MEEVFRELTAPGGDQMWELDTRLSFMSATLARLGWCGSDDAISRVEGSTERGRED